MAALRGRGFPNADTTAADDLEAAALLSDVEAGGGAGGGGGGEDDEDYGEFACPICRDLLLDPVTLACGHTCCQSCLKRWFQAAPIARCPAGCATQLPRSVPRVSVVVQQALEAKYPAQLARRQAQVSEAAAEEGAAGTGEGEEVPDFVGVGGAGDDGLGGPNAALQAVLQRFMDQMGRAEAVQRADQLARFGGPGGRGALFRKLCLPQLIALALTLLTINFGAAVVPAIKVLPPGAVPLHGLVEDLPTTPVQQWSEAEIATWLAARGLSSTIPAFAHSSMNGEKLLTLSKAQLQAKPYSLSEEQSTLLVNDLGAAMAATTPLDASPEASTDVVAAMARARLRQSRGNDDMSHQPTEQPIEFWDFRSKNRLRTHLYIAAAVLSPRQALVFALGHRPLAAFISHTVGLGPSYWAGVLVAPYQLCALLAQVFFDGNPILVSVFTLMLSLSTFSELRLLYNCIRERNWKKYAKAASKGVRQFAIVGAIIFIMPWMIVDILFYLYIMATFVGALCAVVGLCFWRFFADAIAQRVAAVGMGVDGAAAAAAAAAGGGGGVGAGQGAGAGAAAEPAAVGADAGVDADNGEDAPLLPLRREDQFV